MNEIINLPCNSLLAKFLELDCNQYWKRVSYCLKTSVPLLMSLKKKLQETGSRKVRSDVQRDLLKMCVRQKWARRETRKTQTSVHGGVDEVGVSGYESEGFTLSEVFKKKRLFKRRVFECVIDTSHFEKCAKTVEKMPNGRPISIHQSVKFCEHLSILRILLYFFEVFFFWRLQN